VTRPTMNDVHIDVYASNISIAYRNTAYIADSVLPLITVAKQSGKYAKYTKSDWFRNEAKVRAPGALPAEGDYSLATPGEYSCIEYSYGKRVPYEVRANADNPLRPDNEAIEYATDKILLAREIRVAAALFNATTFASYTATAAALTGGGQVAWSTYATSDPIKDVGVMVDNVRQQIGRDPNTIIMGSTVWKSLKNHPDLLDRIKYVQKGVMTTDLFGSLVDLPKVFVGKAIYSNTAENVTFSSSDIWGNYVLVAYITDGPSLLSPSLGYTLTWSGAGGISRPVERYELAEGQKATKYVVSESSDEVICAEDAGYLLTSVV
jgi:hypothetical protein